jgi:hypothetical protein
MSVTFTTTTAYNREDPCAICHEPLGNGQEVASHDDEAGRLHPMHTDCINLWIETRPTCPFCKAGVQVQEKPPTFKEKAVKAIHYVALGTAAVTAGFGVSLAMAIARGQVAEMSAAAAAILVVGGTATALTNAANLAITITSTRATRAALRELGIAGV